MRLLGCACGGGSVKVVLLSCTRGVRCRSASSASLTETALTRPVHALVVSRAGRARPYYPRRYAREGAGRGSEGSGAAEPSEGSRRVSDAQERVRARALLWNASRRKKGRTALKSQTRRGVQTLETCRALAPAVVRSQRAGQRVPRARVRSITHAFPRRWLSRRGE